MELLLQILLFGALGLIAVSAITILALWQTLRRRLRIDPRVRSVAPTHWHLGQHRAARAQRRLRVASKSAFLATGGKKAKTPSSGVSEFPAIAQSIVDRAVLVERDLVQAAKMPRANRSAALQAPLDDVVRIEATVAELVSTASAWSHAIDLQRHDPLDEVHDRLTNLRHASEGVRQVETTRSFEPSPWVNPNAGQARATSSPASFSQSSIDDFVIETE